MHKTIHGKIKILFFIHNSAVTGPGNILRGIIRYLDMGDFTPDVICPASGPLSDDLKNMGIRIIDFRADKIKNPVYLAALSGKIKKEGYHILHIHSGQYSAFWKAMGRILGIPAIIYTEHLRGDTHSWIKNKVKLFLHLLSHPLWNSMVDKVVAVSDTARLSIIKRQRINPQKVCTIYNGIDLHREAGLPSEGLDIRRQYGIPSDAITIGIVGRLTPEKGQLFFIRAAAEILRSYPNTRFLIIGEGAERENLEKLTSELNISKAVIFTGFYPDVNRAIDCMDIVVQSSLEKSESFGLSLVEAMALAKPVIASDIDCFKEIVTNGYNGLLFEAGNYMKLAEKMRMLIDDIALRKELGRVAQEIAKGRFDARAMAFATAKLYKNILRQKGCFIN